MPPTSDRLARARRVWSEVPSVWLWRAGALATLVLALLFAGVALLSTAWWGLLAFLLLAATIVCLVRSEPDQPGSPPWHDRPQPPRAAPVVSPAPAGPSAPARPGVRVADVMTPKPVALPAEAPVRAAARAMRDLDVGALMVVDDQRTLGIVTDRDIVVRALAAEDGATSATVGEICSRDLATVPADSSAADALQVMEERDVRRLPVTARGAVVGIVSLDDLVDAR